LRRDKRCTRTNRGQLLHDRRTPISRDAWRPGDARAAARLVDRWTGAHAALLAPAARHTLTRCTPPDSAEPTIVAICPRLPALGGNAWNAPVGDFCVSPQACLRFRRRPASLARKPIRHGPCA